MIGIISYLPDSDVRNKRLFYVKRLIKELRIWFPTELIHIISQNYSDDDYNSFIESNLLFHKFEKGIGVANARNELLKLFYNSNDKVLILSDDDIKLYNYYNIQEFIINFYNMGEETDADLICGLDASMSPFKDLNIKNNITDYFTLKPISKSSSFNFMMMKKLKKEYYYNQKLIDNNISEDLDFISRLLKDNLRLYCCLSLIKCQNIMKYSTLFSNDGILENHKLLMNNLDNYINENYGFSNYMDLVKYYTSFYKPLKIKRNKKYELQENDYPIRKVKIKDNNKLNNLPLFL